MYDDNSESSVDGTSEGYVGSDEMSEAEPMYVKLISADGHEFVIKRELAILCGTVRAMLRNPEEFADEDIPVLTFTEIHSSVLAKICMYLAYRVHYTNASTAPPEFPIESEIAFDLLMAVNYLEC